MRPGFVYIWRDSKRKKFYLGSHCGAPDDGYVGSSKRFITAYKARPETFRRRILEHHDNCTREFLHERETLWLALIPNEKLGTVYYNEKKVAAGGDIYSTLPAEKQRITKAKSNRIIRALINQGYTVFQAEFIYLTEKKCRQIRKKQPGDSFRGKTHSDETRAKMSEKLKGRKSWITGKQHSAETRKRLQINNPRRLAINTPFGKFISAEDFEKKTGLITANALRPFIRSNAPISKRRAEKSPLLTLADVGKTPEQLGYFYINDCEVLNEL